jgi:hypothetical protein
MRSISLFLILSVTTIGCVLDVGETATVSQPLFVQSCDVPWARINDLCKISGGSAFRCCPVGRGIAAELQCIDPTGGMCTVF